MQIATKTPHERPNRSVPSDPTPQPRPERAPPAADSCTRLGEGSGFDALHHVGGQVRSSAGSSARARHPHTDGALDAIRRSVAIGRLAPLEPILHHQWQQLEPEHESAGTRLCLGQRSITMPGDSDLEIDVGADAQLGEQEHTEAPARTTRQTPSPFALLFPRSANVRVLPPGVAETPADDGHKMPQLGQVEFVRVPCPDIEPKHRTRVTNPLAIRHSTVVEAKSSVVASIAEKRDTSM